MWFDGKVFGANTDESPDNPQLTKRVRRERERERRDKEKVEGAFTLVHVFIMHEYGDFCIQIRLLFTLIHENAYPKRV